MKTIKPFALRNGDTIGVVAPAYPFPSNDQQEYFQSYLKGKTEIERMGFKIKESVNLKAREWWRAGTPKQRADDINSMYNDPEIKAIIAHDGGNDCISILEYFDYDLIAKNPKPFIGFSNITNIHSALYTKIGLVGFHMGLLTYELGNYWQISDEKIKNKGANYFKQVLTNTELLEQIEPLTEWETWKEGQTQGKLFGGNLSMLDSLIGTPYFPKLEDLQGCIFFWEIDNSPSYRIERVLTHLKYLGLFDVISGMIVGKLVDIKDTAQGDLVEPTHKEIVLSILKDYSFPILAEVDFGHKMVQIPMLIGLETSVDATNKKFKYLESAVL
ncbi:MAG: LD-carboxypeptidase [Candidatus Dojkabacteria bacterium]|jgi:muramoyltetrapeptide carboxypeptidase|nr:LD-carboxypeptidase [Candidatus Dojkabacteria bacterium]